MFQFQHEITYALYWRLICWDYGHTRNLLWVFDTVLQSFFTLWFSYIAFRQFHTLFFRHALHEIIFVLTKILFVLLNGEDCLFGLCFGVRYMSGVYFTHWLYSYFYSKEKLRNYNQNLTRPFHGRKFYSNKLRRNDH